MDTGAFLRMGCLGYEPHVVSFLPLVRVRADHETNFYLARVL